MTDITPQDPSPSARRNRPSRAKRPTQPAGEVTRIDVPHPPASSINRERPANALIMAQVEHIHHAEKNRLPRHKLSGKHPSQIHTEAEAAAYIREVTKLLHPLKKKKKKSPPKGA
jgi:hypothetical protein